MKGNRWLKIAIRVTALVVCLVLLVYVADGPMTQKTYYACPICRMGKVVTSYLMIPMRTKVNDNEFSRYYRSYADPSHQHIWLRCGVSRKTPTSNISAHGAPMALRLNYNVALAIAKSLPDRKTRKAFFEHLYVPDGSSSEAGTVLKAILELNDAYRENKHRNDWLDQLHKVGLFPMLKDTTFVPKLPCTD